MNNVKNTYFNKLIPILKSNGYSIHLSTDKSSAMFNICSDKIFGYCGNYPEDGERFCFGSNIEGMICIDRKECYDKPVVCPIYLPIPSNMKQVDFLISAINWLLTDEGLLASKKYQMDKWFLKYEE